MAAVAPRRGRLATFDDASRSAAYRDQFGRWAELWYARLARRIARRAPHADSVLDLGTGPGQLLPHLVRRYGRAPVVGLDRSAAMLALARRAAPPPSVRLVRADFAALPFHDRAFGLVTGTAVLHHADALGALLGEVRRVLKPGGRFVAFAFRRDPCTALRWLARRHSAAARRARGGLEGLAAVIEASWTAAELDAAVAAAGFRAGRVRAGLLELELVAVA